MENILFLYREIMPYNIPVLEEIVKIGYCITVFHDTKKKLTPYLPPKIDNVVFISKEKYNRRDLAKYAISLKPKVVFVSDRTNPKYNYTAVLLRRRLNIHIISGCDTQWRGGKQWFNVFTSWLRHKRFFSHILISGMRQYEYAKKLGFPNDKILWPLYSANIQNFIHNKIDREKFQQPRNFLFVGRFAKVKGLDILLQAWEKVPEKRGATLTLIGNGPLKEKLNYPEDVKIHDFMDQEELIKYSARASCFVLPSVFEAWALVIQEFAAAGLPLIVTSTCGATPHFVINNFNGFIVRKNEVDELSAALARIISMPSDTLVEFARRSRELSYSISPKMVAYAITSVVKK